MLRSSVVALATLIVVATPTVPSGAGAASDGRESADARAGSGITGTWRGRVVNEDGPAGYTGTVRLTRAHGRYRATVAYSKVGTTTKWIYEGRQGPWFRFREIPRSSTDDGASGTEIKVKRSGAKLAVRYYVREADYRGSMKARRLR